MTIEIKAAELVVPRTIEGLVRAVAELRGTLPDGATVIVTPFLSDRLTIRGEWVLQECEAAGCERPGVRLDATGWVFCADHTEDDLAADPEEVD